MKVRKGSVVDFEINPKQRVIRRTVREFATSRIGPIAHELDQQARFPWELMDDMKAMNLFGLQASPEWGGAGMDTISYAITIEELARVCAGIALAVTVHNSVSLYPIEAYGTDEQKRRILPGMCSGDRVGAFCVTEPNAGSDASATETTAILDGDRYILNGNKIWVTNGAIAGVAVVLARTDPEDKKRGLSTLIVERGMRGFSVGPLEDLCGMRSNPVSSLIMTDCPVPKENLLGRPGDGVRIALQTLDVGRIGIASQALGIPQASLDVSLEYAQQRIQFRAPLTQFQSIQNMLADTATEIEATRLLVYQAGWLRDNERPFSSASAMAKLYASEAASRAGSRGVQIHGGYGYSKSYPIERYWRDARVTEIYEGTSEIQRMVIARSLQEKSKP